MPPSDDHCDAAAWNDENRSPQARALPHPYAGKSTTSRNQQPYDLDRKLPHTTPATSHPRRASTLPGHDLNHEHGSAFSATPQRRSSDYLTHQSHVSYSRSPKEQRSSRKLAHGPPPSLQPKHARLYDRTRPALGAAAISNRHSTSSSSFGGNVRSLPSRGSFVRELPRADARESTLTWQNSLSPFIEESKRQVNAERSCSAKAEGTGTGLGAGSSLLSAEQVALRTPKLQTHSTSAVNIMSRRTSKHVPVFGQKTSPRLGDSGGMTVGPDDMVNPASIPVPSAVPERNPATKSNYDDADCLDDIAFFDSLLDAVDEAAAEEFVNTTWGNDDCPSSSPLTNVSSPVSTPSPREPTPSPPKKRKVAHDNAGQKVGPPARSNPSVDQQVAVAAKNVDGAPPPAVASGKGDELVRARAVTKPFINTWSTKKVRNASAAPKPSTSSSRSSGSASTSSIVLLETFPETSKTSPTASTRDDRAAFDFILATLNAVGYKTPPRRIAFALTWTNKPYTDTASTRRDLLRLFTDAAVSYAVTLNASNITFLLEAVSDPDLVKDLKLPNGAYVPARRISALIVRGYLENAGRIILDVIPSPETAELLAQAHAALNALSRSPSVDWPPICRSAHVVVLRELSAESLVDHGGDSMEHLTVLVRPNDICVDFPTNLRASIDCEDVICDGLGNLIRTAWHSTTGVHFHHATGELPYVDASRGSRVENQCPLKHEVFYGPGSHPFREAAASESRARAKEQLFSWNDLNADTVVKEVLRCERMGKCAPTRTKQLEGGTVRCPDRTAAWSVFYPRLVGTFAFGSGLLSRVTRRTNSIDKWRRKQNRSVCDEQRILPIQLDVPTTTGPSGATELSWVNFRPTQGIAVCSACYAVCFDTAVPVDSA